MGKNVTIPPLITLACNAAKRAGEAVLQFVDKAAQGIQYKADASPLTLADKEAHRILDQALAIAGLPILSEEGKAIPYAQRKAWTHYWLIDPIDGTREFLDGQNDFTVNIALMSGAFPVAGVIYVPALQSLYWGSRSGGAYKQVAEHPPQPLGKQAMLEVKKIVVSKHHNNAATVAFLSRYPTATTLSRGSSLKFMLLVEGEAQLYPRLAPTMEWDTAAAQAIVEAAGGMVHTFPTGKRLSYNKENLVNEPFVASAFRF